VANRGQGGRATSSLSNQVDSIIKVMNKGPSKGAVVPLDDGPFYLKKDPTAGRLGNKMFEWASTFGLAHTHHLKPCMIDAWGSSQRWQNYFSAGFPECPKTGRSTIKWKELGYAKHNKHFKVDLNATIKLVDFFSPSNTLRMLRMLLSRL
jgi:hypothetical protein